MNMSEAIAGFFKLPFDEQKRRAGVLGLAEPGDEKRTNMSEPCLWAVRALQAGKFEKLFEIASVHDAKNDE
jgi:hypothetical protein